MIKLLHLTARFVCGRRKDVTLVGMLAKKRIGKERINIGVLDGYRLSCGTCDRI